MFYQLLLVLCLRAVCHGFMPDQFSALSPDDFTNAKITEDAIHNVAAEYVETVIFGRAKSGKPTEEILAEYFKGYDASYNRFKNNAIVLANRVTGVELIWRKHAARNMNGERIVEGNTLLQAIRNEVIELLNKAKWDVEEGSELIAAFLFTLQEFYSSSNWVEMKGAVPYDSLGISGKPLIVTSTGTLFVCRSCSNYDPTDSNRNPDSCKYNIILNGEILTSGYKGGQNVVKPVANTQFDEGKCSHGGKGDTSRFTKATGGINKETSKPVWSPHYHLHEDAGKAALLASEKFFYGRDTSLVNHIPKEAFQELMGLTRGESLVFVIDDTGSMSAEISAVREWTINKVKKTKGTNAAPYDYILSTFNDPISLNTIYSTKDSDDMINKLSKVVAHGGGDCPELALDGILAALKICHPFSTIFVFTDAPSKHEDMAVTIKSLAAQKHVKITFLLTPGCKRKKRSLEENRKYRTKRSADFDDYAEIAKNSGGEVYHTTDKNIAQTLTVIDESLSGHPVHIMEVIIPSTDDKALEIPVDKEISVLTIEVSGVSTVSDVNLYDPEGEEDTLSKSDDTKIMLSNTILLLKKSKPTPGMWKLKRKAGLRVTVNVRGSGGISFRYSLKERIDGLLYPISGNPLVGRDYIAAVVMEGSENIQSLDYLVLVTSEGDLLEEFPIDTTSTHSFTVPLNFTNEAFMFAVHGTDSSGFKFIRIVKTLVTPVSLKLELLPFEDDLVAGEDLNIGYSVVNQGSGSASVLVMLAHSEGVSSVSSTKTHMVASGSNVEDKMKITAGTSQSLVNLKLTLKVSGKVLQEISSEMLIVDPYAPVCKVLETANNCRDVLQKDCSSASWNATFEVTERGFGLKKMYSSANESLVKFSHEEFKSGFKGKVSGTLSASCCENKTEVHSEDLGGAVGSCFFSHTFRQPEKKPWKDYGLVIGLIIGGICLLILIIIIVVVIVRRRKQKNYEKMT